MAMMDISSLIHFILHIDASLAQAAAAYGTWIYAILFAIVFVETGLVVMPFLPGDSLLFVTGALCGAGILDFTAAAAVLLCAAIAGDQLNYAIGRAVSSTVFGWEHSRWFNRRAFDRTHAFYERYGPLTIVLARFLPFVRTFAPFVAGAALMARGMFLAYNVVGAVLWVIGLTVAGLLFGGMPWVKAHLNLVIWALVLVPGVVAVVGAARADRGKAGSVRQAGTIEDKSQ